MTVLRFQPCSSLAPFIKEFLVIESEEDISSNPLPDAFMVMTFRYKGFIRITREGIPELMSAGGLSGLQKSARHFNYSRGTGNLLVLFKEGGLRAFTSIPAHELFGLSISSENIFPCSALSAVLEQLAEAGNHLLRIAILEAFLLSKLVFPPTDLLVDHAIGLIKAGRGHVKIKELASSLFISQDVFEKRFRALAGATPKQYASIIRIRSFLARYPSYASLTEASYDAGYFDQSHFIKDFRLFTGKTPRQFFASGHFW